MRTFWDLELLDILPRQNPEERSQALQTLILDAGTGPRTRFARAPEPAGSWALDFICTDLGEAADLRAFVERCRGRSQPFWLPSWQQDLMIAETTPAGSDVLSVRGAGYGEIHALGPGRRSLYLCPRTGEGLAVRVTETAVDGALERLTLRDDTGAIGVPVDVTSEWLAMYLLLVRLDDDEIWFDWDLTLGAVHLPVRELPREVSA